MNKQISIVLTLLSLMILTSTTVVSAQVLANDVEIRGEVSQLNVTGGGTATFTVNTWDSTNFAGFWYDIDDNRQTEKLSILKFKDSRNIDKDNLEYTTTRAAQKYKVFKEKNLTVDHGLKVDLSKPSSPANGGYYALVGWMAEEYVAVNGKNNKLSKLVLEQDVTDKHTLQVGETWDVGGGYTLTAQSIDAKATPRQAWIVLNKDGKKLDDKVIEQGKVYTYSVKSLAGENDVPVFITYVDSVFAGQTSDMVQLKYTWAISSDVKEVKSGDTFGVFKVDAEQPLTLTNDGSLSLSRDSTVSLAGNMKFKVADSEDNDVRFYPYVEVTTPGKVEVRGTVSQFKVGTATANVTPTATATANVTPTATVTANVTPTATVTANVTPTATVTANVTPTATVTANVTPTATVTATQSLAVNTGGTFTVNKWDAKNFAGFWYDIDNNKYTESLTVLAFKDSRTIEKNDLVYETGRESQKYKVFKEKSLTVEHGLDVNLSKSSSSATGGYYAIVGWMAEKFVAVNGKNNKLSKLVLEQDVTDKHTLQVGETWDIGGGYTLTAQSIDAKATPRQAWIVLNKDGKKLDDKVIEQDKVYTYSVKSLAGENDVPIFVTYVDSVFAGQTSDMVQLKYTWLISDKFTEIKSGDTFGVFKVDSEQPLSLSNDGSVSLSRDSTVSLASNMKFKVADSEDNDVRFYPKVDYEIGNVTITGNETPVPTITTTGNETPVPKITTTGNVTPVQTGIEETPAKTAPITTTKKPTPGFEAIFAIVGLIAMAYVVLRQRR